jgi:branched-chain amino acid transport system ATP-binding protein
LRLESPPNDILRTVDNAKPIRSRHSKGPDREEGLDLDQQERLIRTSLTEAADHAVPASSHANAERGSGDLLVGRNLSLQFSGLKALSNVAFNVRRGELFAIIGPNGAGKTSLLNCISGRYRPSEGELIFDGRSLQTLHAVHRAKLGIARTFQNLALFAHMSVLDNILVGRHHLIRSNFLSEGMYWLSGTARTEAGHRKRAEELIEFLEIESIRYAHAGSLPYGLRKRVELARALALEPKLLLLDEPMAGMNLEEKEDMARYIVEINRELAITVIMIEHDIGVVMDISDRVLVLNYGEVIAEGLPAHVLANAIVKRAYLGHDEQ